MRAFHPQHGSTFQACPLQSLSGYRPHYIVFRIGEVYMERCVVVHGATLQRNAYLLT